MTTRMIRLTILLAGLITGSLSFAASDDWTHCFSIEDDPLRLACYDAYAGNLVQQDPNLEIKPQRSESLFGLDHLFERKYEPDTIVSRVVKVEILARGRRLLTLENGQVWRQADSSSRPKFPVGVEVAISKAAMGNFRLKRTDQNKSISVRRIK